jgi:hypothetical protein
MDYQGLNWIGPEVLSNRLLQLMPHNPGVYVLTNSPSPFAFDRGNNSLARIIRNPELPRILYIGKARDLGARIKLFLGGYHRVASQLQQFSVHVYWTVTSSDEEVELQLTQDYRPLLNQRNARSQPKNLREQLHKLEELLQKEDDDEASYQSFFTENPWIFGLQYLLIESHKHFDDKNIPDFTGVRSVDSCRDIFEIKQPFLELQRADLKPTAAFLEAWNQAERYLDFAMREADYLRREKRLIFENPKCYLVMGYRLPGEIKGEADRKQRHNPRIVHFTYEQVMALARHMIKQIEQYGGLENL